MKRAKLRGSKRNAAVVPGNAGTVDDVPVSERTLADPEPLVREHAAWALGWLPAPDEVQCGLQPPLRLVGRDVPLGEVPVDVHARRRTPAAVPRLGARNAPRRRCVRPA